MSKSSRITERGQLFRQFKPKSRNQAEYIRSMIEHDMVFCTGPAGSGKTACAVGLAIEHYMDGKVDKIVVTRPTIGTDDYDRGLGFLPGDIREKMDPYLRPIYDELHTYIGKSFTEKLIRDEDIEIAPLDFMRGRTFHSSFVIMDEAQNATHSQLKMFTTRMGSRSKMVVNGDIDQHDRYGQDCALDKWLNNIVNDVNGVGVVYLDHSDIVRHKLVSAILTKINNSRIF